KSGAADSIAQLAAALGAQGHAVDAARLYGAAEILRESIGTSVAPADLPEYERQIANARALLDPSAWEAVWAEGRALTMEQALAYALQLPRYESADRYAIRQVEE